MALDMMEPKFGSVVENFKNENEGYKCGYCKSKTSNYSHGKSRFLGFDVQSLSGYLCCQSLI